MKKHKNGCCEWLTFDLFDQLSGIRHASFLRGSFDTPFDVSDRSETFEQSMNCIAKLMGVGYKQIHWADQVHGIQIADVTKNDPHSRICDAMITAEKDTVLVIRHADCQAALFFDPIVGVIANVHAGWRGNVQNIYKETILYLHHKYGSHPKNLHVAISPSLGPNHAEFINYKEEFPPHLWRFRNENNHFNLWEIAQFQLLEMSVPPEQIEIAKLDTFEDEENFYSYRRDKLTGRLATVIVLK